MNVYDFDKTIYKDDSTVDFYLFSLKRHPSVALCLPSMIFAAVLWLLNIIDKTGFKERFYKFLTKIPDINAELELFWDLHEYKIKDFYKKNQREDDVVISASPEFLLKPICRRLGIKYLFASRVDEKSGCYSGVNCWGEEKPKRFYAAFGQDAVINKFYSDSLSDTPLAEISEKSFIVQGDRLIEWKEYRPKKNPFLSREFILFIAVGCINTFNGVLLAWLYSMLIKNANYAFAVGYITALTIAYLLNTLIIFCERINIIRYLKFCVSYIPNFIIQNLIVFIFYNILGWDKLITYAIAAVIGIPITFLFVKLFAFKKELP